MREKTLPENWEEIQLIELLSKLENGSRPKGGVQGITEGVPSLGGEHLDYNGGFKFGNLKYVPEDFAAKMNRGRIFTGDILIVKDGATTGKTSYVDDSFPFANAFVNEHVFICRTYENIDSKYVYHYLRSKEGQERLLENFTGSAQGGINQKFANNTLIPIAPLAEQKRIVAKLDEAFKHLETLKAQLERIPKLLKKFRQTVLTHAVTGKLTEEWRKGRELEDAKSLLDRFYDYKQQWVLDELKKGNSEAKRIQAKLKPILSKKQHDLPEIWEVQSLVDACLLVVDCHNKTAPYEAAGINLVRTSNVKDGCIVLKDMRYVSEKTYKFWSRRCPPAFGDIIFTREAPMGEAAIIPEGMNVCLGQRTMLLRSINDFLQNKFLLYCLLAPRMTDQITEKAVGTGVKHLRVGDVEGIIIPIPPVREQAEIVAKVEELFTKATRIEDLYISLKNKIDKLPQALLAKAFRGEFVLQNGKDEADKLLQRFTKLHQNILK